MKYKWCGPSGYNPEVGAVSKGQELTLTAEQASKLQKLVEPVESVKTIKKGTKK